MRKNQLNKMLVVLMLLASPIFCLCSQLTYSSIKHLEIDFITKSIIPQSSPSEKETFNSNEYHFKYVYDKTKFKVTPKQVKTSHCFCKLESNDGLTTILFSVWDVADENDQSSVFESDFITIAMQQDRDLCSDGKQLIKSCEKTKIGGKEALKTMIIQNVYGISYSYTTYRIYHKGRLYTLDFYIPQADYNKNKNIVNELIKGVLFN